MVFGLSVFGASKGFREYVYGHAVGGLTQREEGSTYATSERGPGTIFTFEVGATRVSNTHEECEQEHEAKMEVCALRKDAILAGGPSIESWRLSSTGRCQPRLLCRAIGT